MALNLQFKIYATMDQSELVFPAFVHHGMFCVLGEVAGVQHYQQPKSFLLLDTGAEVCVGKLDTGLYTVKLLGQSGMTRTYEKLYFISSNDKSTMFNHMALLGQSFLSLFDHIVFDMTSEIPRFIINPAFEPNPTSQLNVRRNSNPARDTQTRYLSENKFIVPLIDVELQLDPDCTSKA